MNIDISAAILSPSSSWNWPPAWSERGREGGREGGRKGVITVFCCHFVGLCVQCFRLTFVKHIPLFHGPHLYVYVHTKR